MDICEINGAVPSERIDIGLDCIARLYACLLLKRYGEKKRVHVNDVKAARGMRSLEISGMTIKGICRRS
jgi:hypothetical protein